MTDEPDAFKDDLKKLEDIDIRLKAIEAKKRKPSKEGHAEIGAGKGYQALGELLGGIFIGLGLGYVCDTYLHTKPFGIIVGAVGGMIVGVYAVVRSASKAEPPDRDT
jgi:ATP synthase protein I